MKTFNLWTLVLVAALSASCGGGGGGTGTGTPPVPPPVTPEPPPTPVVPDKVEGELSVDVIALSQADLGPNGFVIQESGGGQLFGSSAALKALKSEDTVLIAADPASSELSFLGRVETVTTEGANVRVQVTPAHVEDTFKKLSWQIDTAKTGARVAGVVGAQGQVLTKFSFLPRQVGTLSVGEKGGLTGDISFERIFNLRGKELKLQATVKVDNLSLQTTGEFDATAFAGGGGWGKIGATIRGQAGGTVKIVTEDFKGALGDILNDAESWKLLKWRGSGFFNLEGLDNDDKNGRIPLGGLVVIPGGAISFVGARFQNTAVLQTLAKSTAGIIWLYMDMNGDISMHGEAGVKIDNYKFAFGQEYVLKGASFDVTKTREFAPLEANLFASGNFEVKQREGITVAADLLVGGIRPLNLNAFAGIKYTGKFRGEHVQLQLTPKFGATGAWGCFDNTFWAGIEGEIGLRVKGELKVTEPGSVLTKVFGKNPSISIGAKWSGELARFFNKDVIKGIHAVCDGELAPAILEVDVNGSKRIAVVDPDTGKPLTDLTGDPLQMPARIKWTVRNPPLARASGDIGGALINGDALGSTVLVATDPLTGWTASTVVAVGGTCTRSLPDEKTEGGKLAAWSTITCKDKVTDAILVSYHTDFSVGPGTDYQWYFHEHRPRSAKTAEMWAGYREQSGPGEGWRSYTFDKFLSTAVGKYDRATYHAYGFSPLTFEASRHVEARDPVLDKVLLYETIECRPGYTRARREVNGLPAGETVPFDCPTAASVEEINEIRLAENPLYQEYAKRFLKK